MSPYMSSLMSHYYFQVVLPMSLLCRAFVQKKLSPKLAFVYTSSPSHESKISYKCLYDLCPMTYLFILVRRSYWMMRDVSMPFFQQCRSIDFSSLSGSEIRDLYSTLELAILSGRSFLTIDSGITLLSPDR